MFTRFRVKEHWFSRLSARAYVYEIRLQRDQHQEIDNLSSPGFYARLPNIMAYIWDIGYW